MIQRQQRVEDFFILFFLCLWQLLLYPECAAAAPAAAAFSVLQKEKIQVCQNKDCCKRINCDGGLPQLFRDLVNDQYEIEETGCLEHCGMGPNIRVRGRPFLNMDTPSQVAAVVQHQLEYEIPETALWACDAMFKAHRATKPDRKVKILTEVIEKLDNNEGLLRSTVNGHAHWMRAEARLEQHERSKLQKTLDLAREDGIFATETVPESSRAWRILADIEIAAGNYREAIDAVQQWAKAKPSIARKASEEITHLGNMLLDIE